MIALRKQQKREQLEKVDEEGHGDGHKRKRRKQKKRPEFEGWDGADDKKIKIYDEIIDNDGNIIRVIKKVKKKKGDIDAKFMEKNGKNKMVKRIKLQGQNQLNTDLMEGKVVNYDNVKPRYLDITQNKEQ